MKTTKKALLFTFCAVLLVVASVLGTMAYLTSSDTVTNTFTVGKVNIKLDEAKVNEYGNPVNDQGEIVGLEEAPRQEKNAYKLLPGHEYVKDPTVTIVEDSEDAYIRAIVTVKNIDNLRKTFTNVKYYGNDNVFLLQNLVDGWDSNKWIFSSYKEEDKNGKYEFRYTDSYVNGVSTNTALPALFTSIIVPGEEVTNDNIGNLTSVVIDVEAHAIQADGFENADEAWEAFDNQIKTSQATTENN